MNSGPSSSPYLELFLLRHGESCAQTGEETGLDTHLSARGRIQAAQAFDCLGRLEWSHVFCSPLQRARETLGAWRDVPREIVTMDERIRENLPPPEDDPVSRAESVLHDLRILAEKGAARRILLVTHAMFCSTFLAVFSGSAVSCQVYSRLGNARVGFLRIPRNPAECRILAGWNLAPRDLLTEEDGSLC